MKKPIKILSLMIVITLMTVGCGNKKIEDKMTDQLEAPVSGDQIATFKTNYGDIKVKLLPENAPKAVENFVTHAKDGYYDGLIFHRVINNFMIQGGDPIGTGRGGESIWGKPFEDEFKAGGRNIRGALSMANSGPNTNASQFFIVQAKVVSEDMLNLIKDSGASQEVYDLYKEKGGTPHLDSDINEQAKHTVFGQVYEGMDVVDEIASVEVEAGYKPAEDVIIETIEVEVVE